MAAADDPSVYQVNNKEKFCGLKEVTNLSARWRMQPGMWQWLVPQQREQVIMSSYRPVIMSSYQHVIQST